MCLNALQMVIQEEVKRWVGERVQDFSDDVDLQCAGFYYSIKKIVAIRISFTVL